MTHDGFVNHDYSARWKFTLVLQSHTLLFFSFIMKAFRVATVTSFKCNYQPSSLPKVIARTYAMAPNQSIPSVCPTPKITLKALVYVLTFSDS